MLVTNVVVVVPVLCRMSNIGCVISKIVFKNLSKFTYFLDMITNSSCTCYLLAS